MEEIAKTFGNLPGAADIFRFVGETPLADETPETLDTSRTLVRTIQILAERLERSNMGVSSRTRSKKSE